MSTTDPAIARFFAAMQAGAASEQALMELFADDAVYLEPFTVPGAMTTHVGREAVRAAFRSAWQRPLPDQRIALDRIDVQASEVRVEWTCFAAALPGGKGRGINSFTLRAGKIVRLETTFLRSEE